MILRFFFGASFSIFSSRLRFFLFGISSGRLNVVACVLHLTLQRYTTHLLNIIFYIYTCGGMFNVSIKYFTHFSWGVWAKVKNVLLFVFVFVFLFASSFSYWEFQLNAYAFAFATLFIHSLAIRSHSRAYRLRQGAKELEPDPIQCTIFDNVR